MRIYERLRAYRISKGITQTYVAEKLGKSVSRINAIEMGNIRLKADEFEEICRAGLEISPAIFFTDEVLINKNEMKETS